MFNTHIEQNRWIVLQIGIAFCFLLFASITPAEAQTTFATFTETNGGNDFIFSNNGTSGDLNTVGGGSLVDFKYVNVSGVPAGLSGFQSATMTINAPTSTVAALSGAGNSNITQSISGLITINITRNTPFNGSSNLLTIEIAPTTSGLPPLGPYPAFPASISTTDITGSTGGTSASFNGSTPAQSIRYSSDFLDFTQTNLRALAFSFTSLVAGSPNLGLSVGPGGFLNTLDTFGSGNFSSNPLPRYNPPTAAAVNISGRILTADGRGVSRAQVSLTNADGTTLTVISNSFGYYRFNAVDAGQTVVVSVASKRYAFTPQIISVSSEMTNLNFTAQ